MRVQPLSVARNGGQGAEVLQLARELTVQFLNHPLEHEVAKLNA